MSLSRNIPAINAVVNHPAVRPFVGAPDAGYLDFTHAVNRPENWFLMGEHGGFALELTAPSTREIHVFITPKGHGRWAAEAAREAFGFARANGTKTLVAYVDQERRDLALYARRAGMHPTSREVSIFDSPYDVYSVEFASCLPQ